MFVHYIYNNFGFHEFIPQQIKCKNENAAEIRPGFDKNASLVA
jgi:hypothetical protein